MNAIKQAGFRAPGASPLMALARAALALVFVFALASCGGGGTVTAPATRSLPSDFGSRKAVAYSPFRTATSDAGRDAETITAAMVKQDLDLLVAGGFKLIRLFDSSDKVSKLTLQVIKDNGLDMKVMLGIYVLAADGAFSNAEVARGIALANAYKDIVVAVSVGNETLVSWSFNRFDASALKTYITQVRNAVTQPVTTDDNWAFFAQGGPFEQDPQAILASIDFVSMHTYPVLDTQFDLFEWRQASTAAAQRAAAMMTASVNYAKKNYTDVRAKMDALGFGAMPIVIGETGWKAVDTGGLRFRAHPANQKVYFDALTAWAASGTGPKTIFYFEAFDEPWKQGDDKWGLFNVQRQARYVVKDLYPASQWVPAGTATGEPATAAVQAADAVYFLPLVVNTAIAASRYTLFADTVTAGEARLANAQWDAFGDGRGGVTADYPLDTSTSAPGDASTSTAITPKPSPDGYWGLLRHDNTGASANLSGFAGGKLNLWIRTNNYPGKIEIGISTDTSDRNGAEAYLQLSPGNYNYCNTDTWCQVSIPVADFVAANPKLDLRAVLLPFVVADRFAITGKPLNTSGLPKVYIDNIYWSK
jgi:exo-beta-1,3-glucanase (GH17 family)